MKKTSKEKKREEFINKRNFQCGELVTLSYNEMEFTGSIPTRAAFLLFQKQKTK